MYQTLFMRNIKTLLLLFLLLCPALQAFAQSNIGRLAYIKENAVEVINTESHNEDYSDLAPLKKSLEHVEIVGLGGQTHHDGHTF
jgi:erythromycin esterase